MSISKIHIIIARYKEDIEWLFKILNKHENITTTIYNDGDFIKIPIELEERIIIKNGDHIPCEPTKYTSYIIENWDKSNNDILVFLQGDPIYHNPSTIQLFDYVNQWNRDYQNMTLYPHPPSVGWGCSKEIENGTAPNITYFADDARVWCDTNMDDNFNGAYYYDNWLKELFGNRNIAVSSICNTLGVKKMNNNIPKAYSAMFATSWNTIKRHSINVWHNLHNFVIDGDDITRDMSQKQRACIIEYMWAVLLHQG